MVTNVTGSGGMGWIGSVERQSQQDMVADGVARSKAHHTKVAGVCAYLVRGTHYPSPMYHLPPLPLACLSPPNLALLITYFCNNLFPMPSILINLFLSSLSDLINVFSKHPMEMVDYLA